MVLHTPTQRRYQRTEKYGDTRLRNVQDAVLIVKDES